ncbi:AAA family ATPase [Streptomyces sp. KLOTTS4A1]|uniref:AAA family ATPase n=1 Tax=Streptomyces sp. KLOTTS4A1 TaxID=3390996 RepID=UPI0039F4B738
MPAHDAVARAVEQTLAEQAVMCLYGDAGCGKTYALQTALASRPELPGDVRICHLSPRPAPTPTALRAELLLAAGLPIPTTRDPGVLDTALRTQLAAHPHLLVVDEASRLTTDCVEYLCFLFDDPTTQLTLILATSTKGFRMLRRQPLLATRTTHWLQIHPLTYGEVRRAIPQLHPRWHDAGEAVLDRLDVRHGHGNFRRWAQITHHTLRLEHRASPPASTLLETTLDGCLPPHEDLR